MPEALWILDCALAAAGFVVLLVFVSVGRKPLWRWPPADRGRIRPEHVALPILGFVVVQLSLAPAVESSDVQPLIVNAVGGVVGATLCVVIGAVAFSGGMRGFLLGTAPWSWRRTLAWSLGGLLAALPLVWAAEWISIFVLRWASPGYAPPDHPVIELLARGELPAWIPVLLWVGAVGVAPFAEEAFFRGVLQTAVVRFVGRPVAAIVPVAVLFGLAHAAQPHAVVPLSLFGFVLGYVYERSGTLVVPIALHALFNVKTLLYVTALHG